jgi:hypothetical protein
MSTAIDADPWGYEFIKALAKASRCKVPDLLAMGRCNDPFYAGAAGYRVWGEWFAAIWLEHEFPAGTHVRRVHYRLVSRKERVLRPDGKPFVNNKDCWNKLEVASKYARHLGLLDAMDFEDRRNPDPHLFADYGEGIPSPSWFVDDIPPLTLPRIPTDLGEGLDLSIPRPGVQGYEPALGDQPYHLEVWIEKSTENDELIPVCEEFQANLITGVGYQSITSAVKLLKRLNVIQALLARKQPVRIFYIVDFDPAGVFMPGSVARQLEFYLKRYVPDADIKLMHLALTREQVIEYRLPRKPIEAEEDPRKAGFEEQYGEGAVELDALSAIYPGELRKMVRDAMEPYRDKTLVPRLQETEEEAQDMVTRTWNEAMGPHQDELTAIEEEAREIYGRYRQRLEELDAQLGEELAPLAERLDHEFHCHTGYLRGAQDRASRPT